MQRILPHLLVLALLLSLPLPAAARVANPDDDRRSPVVRAVEAVSPSVVNITVLKQAQGGGRAPFGDTFFDQFFKEFYGQRQYQAQSLGSGVIIDGEKALVLTNSHVISGSATIAVRLKDGREFKADLVGSDPDFDLAVLRLRGVKEKLPEMAMGDSDDIYIGETAIAIGNPFGYSNTVTTGVISALNRPMKTNQGSFGSFIQTDAAINPGNSGGPLLNIHGELIGINTAIRAQAEGIGFAIPINKAKHVIDELIHTGHVAPIWLGLFGQDIDQPTAHYFRLKNLKGMLVAEVMADTPARAAGLRPGDVVLGFNGQAIQDKNDYMSRLFNITRAEKATLAVLRDGKRFTVSLEPKVLDAASAQALVLSRWGFGLGDNGGRGALVTRITPGSPADKLGLRNGDIIHQIGNRVVGGSSDLINAFLRNRMQNTVIMRVQRGNNLYYVRLSL
ncbi:trypsin-like peptidase domain-containing protein [Pseudodesulfovibrio sp.]|uniref:trypsin-like peptidase domain-containing protein n=1 Tax=Pseudodesulfovibrio sp. TaxID=2035812 RepID=UPI00261A0913|nr:trypsin-like peptidase domain-containing protein [Pseudodesulfovibrio sp.]MDD3312251.1 trypsin-like peptidase domain-containing protein [Pseudodesulfovibrio sp.]